MVVRGRFPRKAPAKKQPNKKSPTSLIGNIASLSKMADRDRALDILHDIAIEVAPVMRSYGFKVGVLCEFFPKNPNLLGLNVNGGSKICIRLRPSFDKNRFLPINDLIGTMLHELTHNKFGPHDASFYKLLDELNDKYNGIKLNGALTSTGYVAENRVLGSSSYTNSSVRDMRVKKLSEIKYVAKTAKLGTNMDNKALRAKSMRELMLEAAERRARDNKTCSSSETGTNNLQAVPEDGELEIVELSDDESEKETNNTNDSKREVIEILSDPEDEELLRKKVKRNH